MPRYAGEAHAVIDGPVRAVFDTVTDFERLCEWQGPVRSATVLSRDEEGRGRDVAYEIDVGLRVVRYTLRHGYDPPHVITSEYVEGDFRDCDGEWTFRDLGDATTEARFALRIDPGRFVPGPIVKMLNERVMQAAVDDLCRRFRRERV